MRDNLQQYLFSHKSSLTDNPHTFKMITAEYCIISRCPVIIRNHTWVVHKTLHLEVAGINISKSGNSVVLLKIFLNKANSNWFINLSPIFFIFYFPVSNDVVHISCHFGCHGNHLGRTLWVTIITK